MRCLAPAAATSRYGARRILEVNRREGEPTLGRVRSLRESRTPPLTTERLFNPASVIDLRGADWSAGHNAWRTVILQSRTQFLGGSVIRTRALRNGTGHIVAAIDAHGSRFGRSSGSRALTLPNVGPAEHSRSPAAGMANGSLASTYSTKGLGESMATGSKQVPRARVQLRGSAVVDRSCSWSLSASSSSSGSSGTFPKRTWKCRA